MLGLMVDDKLTNAGYFLFSSKKPTVLKWVYATDERINFLDINRVHDNIYNLIDIATVYINQHMNWRVEFDGKSTARIEIPEVPVDAVREIIVNAFAHVNYRSITEHEIDITPTMIDIYNPGEFPINYKPEDFAERRIQSKPRNRKILDVLYRSKNFEVQGSGIRKVLELCTANNVKYKYYNNEFGFRFSFYRNNVTTNVTTNVTIVLNNTDKEVLKMLKEKPEQTREKIASKIGNTVRTVQRSLDKLKEAKKIAKIGNKNYGHWEVIE
ncbi:ATP-binding protein [Mycoplasmopsis arginini]|uniref:ATP-binding protein n=1 Tax=Mycoplasmopsis arginini TaxID=2094 RepID=UPI00227D5DEB|nr:ATP-binding protein [Mycoplasmopsis arginini]MCY2903188.1 putative DNA binding domain-containing protein [Mycoplasmopsis arginini QMP CG1-2758]MDI3352415.1 putative DNA binding domain-containing protein [Mycoplasmopsis arginini]